MSYIRKKCKKCGQKKKVGHIQDSYDEKIVYYICDCEIEEFKKLEQAMYSKRYGFFFYKQRNF